MKIVVIDYRLGNISSIINMLKKLGVHAIHSGNVSDIQNADKLILPGVGAFDHGMQGLHESGLIPTLNEEVLEKKKPILGICLGMQLLFEKSAEGIKPGLAWLKGECIRFNFTKKIPSPRCAEETTPLKIPHMGWNVVKPTKSHTLFNNEIEERFYFVHSYHPICDEQHILATTYHGYEFPSVVGTEHILGAQFHPEKSHQFGMHFLKQFVEMPAC